MTFWLCRLFARTATIAICLLAPISRVGEELPNRKMGWTACDPRNTTPRVSKASGVPSLSRASACSSQTFSW